MAQVNFNYKGYDFRVQCNMYDKIKDIFNRFYIKSGVEQNSVHFLYGGQNINNTELTLNQIANTDDKYRNKMNIVVIENYNNFSYGKTKKTNQLNYINYNPQNFGKPNIFQIMEQLNKRFDEIESEMKLKSANMRRRIEEMQNKLRIINKKRIRFNDATYYGETLGNEITGLYIIENDDGNRYEGYMLNCDRSGIGIFYGIKGDIYMGEYKNNERIGFGIEETPQVGIYEGTWLNNGINGIGVLSFKDGVKYIGPMDKGQLSGFGKMIWPDGVIILGNLKMVPEFKGKNFTQMSKEYLKQFIKKKEISSPQKVHFIFLME